jgi:hypothetical protein
MVGVSADAEMPLPPERREEEVHTPAEEQLLEEADVDADQEEAVLEERMVKHVHPAKGWLFASILLTLFIALLSSITTESNSLLAFVGFAPTIITVVIFIGLLEGEFRDALFWLTPLAMGMLFLAVGSTAGGFFAELDLPVLTGVNMLLSYVILAIMTMIEYGARPKEKSLADVEEFEPEQLDQYIHTIEDKCKALNFVIGRVYRASHGGTRSMRDKIKVPSDWYNEFNSIPSEEVKEQKELAIDLLNRIKGRLQTLLQPEKDTFSKAEIVGLKHLARDKDGKDRVLDVLSVNDQDPVEDYFLGAMDFCKRVLDALEKL